MGLRPDSLPDIVWCAVPGGEIELEDEGGTFTVQPFHIAKYPITFIQFQAFLDDQNGFDNDTWWEGLTEKYRKQAMETQHSKFVNHPRDSVSWYQTVAFCRWLSAKLLAEAWPEQAEVQPGQTGMMGRLLGREQGTKGWEIRLPTEWE